MKIAREINPSHLKRADSVDNSQAGSYMDSIAMSLHQAIDAWRYNNGPMEDVSLCVDALVAMWTSIERRSN